MKLQNQTLANRMVILPVLGETNVSEDGIIEIEDQSLAEQLSTAGWIILNEKGTSKKTVVSEGDEEVDSNPDAIEETLELLKQASLPTLIEYAKESEFPEKEWKKLAENQSDPAKLMFKYIEKQLNKK
jgi:hypothetical protein